MGPDSASPPPPPSDQVQSLELDRDDLHFVHNDASASVGESIDEGTGRIFPCEQCGADLRFHIGQQSLHCDYCNHTKEIEFDPDASVEEKDFHETLRRISDFRQCLVESTEAAVETQEIRCESCGGNVEFVGTLTSRECPYCASPVQLEKAHKADSNRIPVDGVLPFAIERKLAEDNLRAWVESRWFAPTAFRKRGVDGEFNGVYLSYFTFDSMTYSEYTGQRGEHYYVTVRRGDKNVRKRKTRWYDARGRFQRFFDDILILANNGFAKEFMDALQPWPLIKVVPFNQQLLAGHFARTYDRPLDECFDEAKHRIDQAIYRDVIGRIGGDDQRVHNIDSQYDAITYKHLLLPVWLLAYRFGEKPYHVFVNASTGEVQGQRPYSAWKIAFTVLAVVAIVVGVGFLCSQRG
jgi:predicted RNA-binding Zn-ribbon protein involved in translation (DUF1610 family)